jgi:glucose-1-phosphate adenylyltransferase
MRPNALVLILAGGKGTRMGPLCAHRAKPVLPFLGQHRVIDLTLWNTVDSGLGDVAVLTDYQRISVHESLKRCAPCVVDVLDPPRDSYIGTADAVYQNLDYIMARHPDVVLVLAADHVYRMDYGSFLDFHQASRAGVTVGLVTVPIEQASRFGVAVTDQAGRIVSFTEKPVRPASSLISMGIYAFSTQYLAELLREDALAPGSAHDFGHSIIPVAVSDGRAYGYRFDGYWRDIGTVASYHQAHMECLRQPELMGLPLPLLTGGSYIAPDAVVEGMVERSVIGPGVVIEAGAIVRDSILMDLVYVRKGAIVERAVLDQEVTVGEGARIGIPPGVIEGSITVLGKSTSIPPGSRIPAGAGAEAAFALERHSSLPSWSPAAYGAGSFST